MASSTHRFHIAIVDDDQDIRDVLSDALSLEGFRATPLADGQSLITMLEHDSVDLVLLDLRLQNESGLTVAQRIRERSSMPILMFTGQGDETDRILGLEIAADDFIMKPFSIREIVARVRALLRRSTQLSLTPQVQEDPITEGWMFDGWCLDTSRRTLRNPAGCPVELTYGEYNLLSVLIEAPNRVLSRDYLLERTHGTGTESFDRTIDVLILRLRRKLEENPKMPRYIKTERGIGYRLDARIARL